MSMAKQHKSPVSATISRPPVVTILGHVDHGKTTLLDTIRKTNVAAGEAGGITQGIGAYQIETNGKKITFIDTPGHEAFAAMRARGARVADIAVLVVAANDGVQPQTQESIRIIQAAKVPTIVALNKIDVPGINTEKIKKQLTGAGLQLEEYGGETPVVPISALKGEGIEKLLDMIQLLSELHPAEEQTQGPLKAIVIESELSKQKGAVATVIIRQGTVSVGNTVFCDGQTFRIRALLDWQGKTRPDAHAGDPVQILGWQHVPGVGSILTDKTHIPAPSPIPIPTPPQPFLPATQEMETPSAPKDKVKLIIKADTAGSLEAIAQGIKNIASVVVIASGVGQIRESDILLAKTTKSLVVGFNQHPDSSVKRLAQSEKVLIKTYTIIYELFNELDDVVEAIRLGNLVTILGEANILALFPYEGEQVAGIKVVSGRIARGDQIKIMRGEQEMGRARIKSLRHKKEDITKAEKGTEAGALLSHPFELLTGDSIIAIG